MAQDRRRPAFRTETDRDRPVLIFRGIGRRHEVIATLKLYIEGMGNKTLGEIYDTRRA